MSLDLKTERAVKQLLVAGGITFQILTGHEDQETTVAKRRVIINALGGPTVTPKARVVRNRVEIILERVADKQPGDTTTPADDLKTMAQQVHQVLEDNATPLAQRLRALGGTDGIGDFTCGLVVPLGELQLPPKESDRVLRSAWGYTMTVSEMIAT